MTDTAGILAGLRVLDLSTGAAAALAARCLAESGAEALRITGPGGDPGADGPAYAVRNRSKRLLAINLEDESGRAALAARLAGADVLIHDFGPARAQELGLDDARLTTAYPQLVICAVTGFPGPGPMADRPAADNLVLARAGLLDEFMGLRRTEGPIYMRVPFATLGAARLAVVAVLARLIARRRDGGGGVAHTSLLQGALASMGSVWSRAEGDAFSYMSRTLSRRSPAEGGFGNPRYRCADRLWMQIVGVPDFLPMMAEALRELGESVPTPPERRLGAGALSFVGLKEEVKAKAFALRPRAQWLEALWEADVPAFPCLQLGEIYADEQARANGFSLKIDGTWQPGAPYRTEPPSKVRPPEGALADWPALAPAARLEASARPPLDGLKVLDLGQYIAGPYSTMILADLGAKVIKLEPPQGEGLRPPTSGRQRPARSFAAGNRGKRAIALDLKDPDAAPVVQRLIAWADVVHHNVRLAGARRLGLDYETLSAARPDLIYCHVDAYGANGPRTDWPGFDPLSQAASGWQTEAAGEGNPPMWLRNSYMDYHCGLAAAAATLLAVYHRFESGRGQSCGASLLGECLQSVGEVMMDDAGRISDRPRLDADQTGVSPFDRLYRCEDGRWLSLLATTVDQQVAALSAFEAGDPASLEALIGGWPREYALTVLGQVGVPAEPALQDQMEAFFKSAANRTAGLIATYESRDWGRIEQVGALFSFGDLSLRIEQPPPALGEHSRDICAELDVDPDLTQLLVQRGALRAI
jgi:crotonobetainyl-CoA:carnitine CoA-transferase CaiB-like acyl-CoA transferase